MKSNTGVAMLVLAFSWTLGIARGAHAEEPWYRSYEKGVEAVQAEKWEEASELLSLAMESGPAQGRSVRTYGVRFVDFLPGYYLAIAHYNLGRYEQAAETLNDVLGSRAIKEGDEEFPAAQDLLSRATVALRASRGLETPAAEDNLSRSARVAARGAPAYSRGRYVAIAIGNQEYQHFPGLNTPIADARAISALLEQSYGFETRVLENAGRADILDGIDETMNGLSENDSLLIYYAGHGVEDQETNEGYWLPVTARPDRRSEWLSNSEIRTILHRSPARHVLVIADSCFSGTLTRAARVGNVFGVDLDRYYEKLASQKSRTALTSGGREPVDDGGGGGHSIFTSSLLRALETNDKSILEAELLHTLIKRDVVLNSTGGQQPLYSDVRNTGHENGDFLFVRTTPLR